jgi:hypothetical protein
MAAAQQPPLKSPNQGKPFRAGTIGCFRDDELDAYFATLGEIKPMQLMNLGDHDISDNTLKATGFTAPP